MSQLAAPHHLLFIEDDPSIVRLLETLIEPHGYSFEALGDLGPAFERLRGEPPGLVLLDLVLPSGDGLDFLRRMRAEERWARVPCMVLSARPAAKYRRAAFEVGADDYIEKPFDLDTLVGKIQSMLRLTARTQPVDSVSPDGFESRILDCLPSGIMVLDDSFRIRYINPNGAEMLGLDRRRISGRPLSSVLPSLETQLSLTSDQHEVRVLVGGEERLIGYTTASLSDGGLSLVFRDLATVERLRRVETGAQRFVHEIRNPLTAVRAVIELLVARDIPLDRRNRLAAAAAEEADRVIALAESYLAQRQTRRAVSAGVPLEPLLLEVVDVNLLGIPSPPTVVVTCPPGLPPIRSDRSRLRQVVLNLLLNAVEVTRNRSGLIHLRGVEEEGGVIVEVSDNGPGIESDVMPRIFDERFSTRPDGDGIGLAIVRQIVDEEGGRIDVRSYVTGSQTGTTFRVWLPAVLSE